MRRSLLSSCLRPQILLTGLSHEPQASLGVRRMSSALVGLPVASASLFSSKRWRDSIPQFPVKGARHYRLIRDIGNQSTSFQGLFSQFMSMPEVHEAREYYEKGRMPLVVQRLARAEEICASSQMSELSLLACEALAHTYAIYGDFGKEESYRMKCIQFSSEVAEKSPSPESDLAVFDANLSMCVTNVKVGFFDTVTMETAKKQTQFLGKDGPVHLRACELTECIPVINGSHPSYTTEEAVDLLLDRVEACKKDCASYPALIAAGHVLLGMAYEKRGDPRSQQSWEAAVEAIDRPTIDSEAAVKISALRRLSRLATERKDYVVANEMAGEALRIAETVDLAGAVSQCLYTTALARQAAGDFVVAEGLLRSCSATLMPQSGRHPTVWELLLLQDVTNTWATMLEGMSINNNSRKPEADLLREQLHKVTAEHPIALSSVEALRASELEQWQIRVMSPNIPLILQRHN